MTPDEYFSAGHSPEPENAIVALLPQRSDGDDSTDKLRQRSGLMARLKAIPSLMSVLVIDDDEGDIRSITTILKLLQGTDLEVRSARSLGTALDQLKSRPPQVVFLDDWLSPSENADTSIAFLRRFGYAGPIVVIAGEVTRRRKIQLREQGASAVISKDDLDGMTLAEVLIQVANDSGSGGATPAAD